MGSPAASKRWREKNKEHSKKYTQEHKPQNAKNNAAWKERHRERYLAGLKCVNLRSKYGITLAQRNEILAAQGNVCGACGSPNTGRVRYDWSVDHCHETKRVRGILCHPCNLALGHVKDCPDRLNKLIQYLEKVSG